MENVEYAVAKAAALRHEVEVAELHEVRVALERIAVALEALAPPVDHNVWVSK